MVRRPKTLPADITVADARKAFENASVKMLLLVEGDRFRGAVTAIPAEADPDGVGAHLCRRVASDRDCGHARIGSSRAPRPQAERAHDRPRRGAAGWVGLPHERRRALLRVARPGERLTPGTLGGASHARRLRSAKRSSDVRVKTPSAWSSNQPIRTSSEAVSNNGTKGLRSRTGVPSRRSRPFHDDSGGRHADDASERESERIRTTWRARRERPMPFVVEERSHRGFPADDLVKVGDYPDVGEAVEICKASTMRCRDLDRRLAPRVCHRLQRHPVELGVRRADVSDRVVDDRLDDATVEQAFHERERRTTDRESPETQGSGKASRRLQLRLECRLRARKHRLLVEEESRGVEAATVEEKKLQHELRAEISHVRGREVAPAMKPRASSARGSQDGAGRAGVARRRRPDFGQPIGLKLAQGSIDERTCARVDAPDVSRRPKRLGDSPPMGGRFAQEAERGPLR